MVTISYSSTGCPDTEHISSYADCTLDDEQAVLFEEHLSRCSNCSAALASVVERGVAPNWLSSIIPSMIPSMIPAPTSADGHSSNVPIPPTPIGIESIAPANRYQMIRLKGEGGMGQVWEGWDVVMKRRIALKQLRSDNRGAGQSRRLWQEAASLARLSHPNIVSVHEVLMLNEQPTLVMEFIDGPSLANIARDTVMNQRQAARILERLADAIGHAHDQGVIHRDLKPSNVLLGWPDKSSEAAQIIDNAIPKLTDFGLARVFEGDDLTRTGDLLGTPAYMAPEQTVGLAGVVGPAADVYGLGAILYDLLTGTPPHVAENPLSTMLLVREREPTAPGLLRPELSKDIETICLKCLQKLPKDRYASAKDLQNDLLAYLDGRPISAQPVGFMRTAVRWSRRHKSLVASAVLATSLVLTLLLGSLWTAAKERQLRLVANAAKTQAELSEKNFMAEAERANRALDVNRKHFDVALDRVNRLAYMAYNPLNQAQTELDYNREIRQATRDIYATYLAALPPPEQWTLQEAHAVTFYVKYMTALGSRDVAAPWLERVKSIVSRLESEGPDTPKLHEFLAQHYTNAHIHAYADGDFHASGKYGEQAARFVDVDARQAAFVLMNSALAYSQIGSHADAIRAANRSVEVYRTAMVQPNQKPDDRVNFLDKLKWHRHIANTAEDKDEANKYAKEFEELASQFDENSPFYARVQSTIADFSNRPK